MAPTGGSAHRQGQQRPDAKEVLERLSILEDEVRRYARGTDPTDSARQKLVEELRIIRQVSRKVDPRGRSSLWSEVRTKCAKLRGKLRTRHRPASTVKSPKRPSELELRASQRLKVHDRVARVKDEVRRVAKAERAASGCAAVEQRPDGGGKSVRAVSGGLPGLGRR